jgi:hypothetical protein
VIQDFVSGIDRIDLRALGITDFDAQVAIGARSSTVTVVQIDLDRDGRFDDFGLQFNGGVTPVESDFIL